MNEFSSINKAKSQSEDLVNTTSRERIFNLFIKSPKGVTFRDLVESCEQRDKQNVSARLADFVNEGLATKIGKRDLGNNSYSLNVYVPTGLPLKDAKKPPANLKKRRKIKSKELQELQTLRAFKAQAILRHPDLAVSRAKLAARQAVAAMLREGFDEGKAQNVIAGFQDDTIAVRVAESIIATYQPELLES